MLDRAEVSAGHLLGGRVRYAQPRAGFRTGIEPVLLAAAVPARAGERVLEAGTGAGAALLCLGARVLGIGGVGIERDGMLAALAERNLAANGVADRFSIVTADLAALPELGAFDHACANPPWHDPGGTASPIPAREAAKRAAPGLCGRWVELLSARLRPRGSLTLILPAGSLATPVSALAGADCGSTALLPLWPKPGAPAKLILLQAVKGSAGPSRVLPGLTLHRPDGGYTEEAEAILRHGAPLPL
jgi:tRNA1Val (adenine37-N6)-methyltransferase